MIMIDFMSVRFGMAGPLKYANYRRYRHGGAGCKAIQVRWGVFVRREGGFFLEFTRRRHLIEALPQASQNLAVK